MIIVAGWVDVEPSKRAQFLEERREKALVTRKEPGCIVYTLGADSVDEGRVRVFECWEDRAAFDARRANKPNVAPTQSTWEKAIAKEIVAYEVSSSSPVR